MRPTPSKPRGRARPESFTCFIRFYSVLSGRFIRNYSKLFAPVLFVFIRFYSFLSRPFWRFYPGRLGAFIPEVPASAGSASRLLRTLEPPALFQILYLHDHARADPLLSPNHSVCTQPGHRDSLAERPASPPQHAPRTAPPVVAARQGANGASLAPHVGHTVHSQLCLPDLLSTCGLKMNNLALSLL